MAVVVVVVAPRRGRRDAAGSDAGGVGRGGASAGGAESAGGSRRRRQRRVPAVPGTNRQRRNVAQFGSRVARSGRNNRYAFDQPITREGVRVDPLSNISWTPTRSVGLRSEKWINTQLRSTG